MEFIEKPRSVLDQLKKARAIAERKNRRLAVVKLNETESRIFWEDLIDDGIETGDPTSNADYAAWAAPGEVQIAGVKIMLNVPGV